MRRLGLAVLLVGLGCGAPEGKGVVRGHFSSNECKPGTPRVLEGFAFEAGYLATERFGGVLLIILQKHRVDVEETDGLVIRVRLDALLRTGALIVDEGRGQIVRKEPGAALALRTSSVAEDANIALSLFLTCPEFPTHYAVDGLLRLEKLTLSKLPEQTGEGESIGGTLTATLTRSNAEGPVGTLDAEFDFSPPRRPLTDFK